MTVEEAINNIKEIQGIITDAVPCCDPDDNWGRYTITLNIAIRALEKQIPEKPIEEFLTRPIFDCDGNYVEQSDTMIFRCPACENVLARGEIEKSDCAYIHFCDSCGKAIDWSETE